MPVHSRTTFVWVVAAVTLLAGCGQTAGQARARELSPPPTETPNTSGETVPTPTAALPARPRAIEMSTTGDPCQLLTPAQQQRFGMDRFLPEDDTGFGHPGCTFKVDSGPWYGFTVTPKPDLDARRLLTDEFGRRAKLTSAAGFPAVESRPGLTGQSNLSCFVNVDVADGQSLEVQSLLISTEAFTSDEMCEKTRLVAEAAMATLLSRQ